jgi:two-component system cell cycle sensor histidine kinase/response regulator CckA
MVGILNMADRRDMLSQTIRIDIPPDLLKSIDPKRGRRLIAPARKGSEPRSATGALGLLELDSNFHELFQHVYDGALIADLSGRIMDANKRACEFLHYERADFQNFNITDIISGADSGLVKALQANLEKDLFTLIQCYCARKDRSLFPSEIAVNHLKLSTQGYLCFFIRDVTLRRQADELLRTEHNAIQNSSNGIGIATLDAQFEYVNPAVAQMWGYDRVEEVIGRNIVDFLADPALATTLIEAGKAGKVWAGRALAKRKNGSIFHVQISLASNRDSEDELVGMVFSFLDISDSLRAEEAERQTERQRVMVESLGTACHHLGQPATVILASLDVLNKMAALDKNEVVTDLLSSSIEAAETLRTMLHDLNNMTEYKTRPYLENQGGTSVGGARILDL